MQNIPINLSSQEILQQYNQEASIDNMREEETMPKEDSSILVFSSDSDQEDSLPNLQ